MAISFALVFVPTLGWADTYTYDALISPSSPTVVGPGATASVSFDVPQDFGDLNLVTSVQYEVFFSGDLLDPGESFFLCNPAGGVCYGKYNGETDPMDSFSQYWNRDSRFLIGTGFPNGGVLNFEAQTFGPEQTVNLSAVTLTVTGTAVTPEPRSAVLAGIGFLTGISFAWRSRTRKG